MPILPSAALIENQLYNPDQSGRLRYSGVGMSEGNDLDLVITQTPDTPSYSTFHPNKNGFNCSKNCIIALDYL